MKIIGIDPGLKATAYAVIEIDENVGISYDLYEGINLLACGEVDTSLTERRFLKIFNDLNDVMTNYTPDYASIEHTFVNINPRTSLALVGARSIAILATEMHEIPYVEMSASTIKKAFFGRGDATKEEIVEKISSIFGVKLTHNIADAIAIGAAGFLRLTGILHTGKEMLQKRKLARIEKKNLKLQMKTESLLSK